MILIVPDAHKVNSAHILTNCSHHYFTDEAKKKIKDVLLTKLERGDDYKGEANSIEYTLSMKNMPQKG